MNRLSYQLIIDKRIKRQISIMSILSIAKYPVTFEELSEKIGVTERTLSDDVKNLIDQLPEEIEIQLIPKVGINLVWKSSYLLSDFISKLADNNPIFEIIENLFLGVEKNVEDYASHLFLSESTLKKKLSILKKVLKTYYLDLSLRPLKIIGSEFNIRGFFFAYFRDTKKSSFVSPQKKQLVIQTSIVESLKLNYDFALHSDYRRALHWLIITEQRILSNQPVIINPSLIAEQQKKESYIRFKKIYTQQIATSLNLGILSEDEIVFAYLVRLDTVVYTQNSDPALIMMYEEIIPDKIMADFLAKYAGVFNLSTASDCELIQSTKAFLSNIFLLTKLSPLFQKNSFELNQKIKTLHSFTYSKCIDLITTTEFFKFINIKYIEDVAASLTLVIAAHIYEKNLIGKKILFSLTGESTYLNYFIMLSNCFLPRNLDIIFSFNERITNNLLTEKEVDLWVHNYPIDYVLQDCVSFQISPIPSIDEWTLLIKLLIDVAPDDLHSFFDSYSENLLV